MSKNSLLTVKEVAENLGCSEGNVYALLEGREVTVHGLGNNDGGAFFEK